MVFLDAQGRTDPVVGAVEARYLRLIPGYDGLTVDPLSLNIADNDTAGVVVRETGGSTDVVEGSAGGDSYSLVLTRRPTADVVIKVLPQITKATRGIIRNDVNQMVVSADTLTFTAANWNVPQTVTVTAVDDKIVDGGDTRVFSRLARASSRPSRARSNSTAAAAPARLVKIDPLLLPGELNIRKPTGEIVRATAADGSTPPGATDDSLVVLKADVFRAFGLDTGAIGPGLAADTSLVVSKADLRRAYNLADAAEDFSFLVTRMAPVVLTGTTDLHGTGIGLTRSIVAVENVDADLVRLVVDASWGLSATQLPGLTRYAVEPSDDFQFLIDDQRTVELTSTDDPAGAGLDLFRLIVGVDDSSVADSSTQIRLKINKPWDLTAAQLGHSRGMPSRRRARTSSRSKRSKSTS